MNPLVSVIVPVYNAVDYIEKMMDSVLTQTYDNYEVLLIVDGSTDGSYEICKKYASIDKRIILIYQPNQGICRSRNKGIRESKGKYILFVDHDDEISPKLIEKVVASAENDDVDLVKYGFTVFNISKKNICCNNSPIYNDILYDKNGLYNDYIYILKNEVNIYIWDALYRSDFIKKNSLYFDEKYQYGGEDIAFNISMIPYIKKMKLIHENLYYHYNRENQSTSLKYSDDIFKSKIWQLDEAQKIYEECFEGNKYPIYYAYFASKLIGGICTKGRYMDKIELSIKYLIIMKRHIKWNVIRKTYIKPGLSIKRKLVLILNALNMNRILSACFLFKYIKG